MEKSKLELCIVCGADHDKVPNPGDDAHWIAFRAINDFRNSLYRRILSNKAGVINIYGIDKIQDQQLAKQGFK